MSLLGKVVLKLMPKKLLNKVMRRAFKKAPKVDCGLFAQAAKKNTPRGLVGFPEYAARHGGVAEDELTLVIDGTGKYLGESNKTLELVRNSLHKNVEFSDKVLTEKVLLG